MIIKEIYDLPIEREIKSAVVVSDQKAETIKAEIEEYVFTNDIIEKLYKFLDTFINQNKNKTGVWINGYYGSGKSHFIKYINYCLNPDTREKAFEHYLKYVGGLKDDFTDVTLSNVTNLKNKIAGLNIDNIMFNVEDETDDGSGERLTRIFLNMFFKFQGYNPNNIPLAILFEKYMDSKGKFEEFKQVLKEKTEFDWDEGAADYASFELNTVLEIAKGLVPELDIVSLHPKLSDPDTYKVGINATLIPQFKEYLANKGKNYRMLFLVDEISQYIGSNKEILLNLQNIIERINVECNNQVWIACTAQQTLEEVSSSTGSNDMNDEFGKILGRFAVENRISLDSTDAAYITQKRVLNKNAKGEETLMKMYASSNEAIQHQFQMNHSLYKGFGSEDDFILGYPFVPYQFKLIAQVFDAFQNLGYVIKEVKDNERSVIGITHFTAMENANKNVGEFIPFDAFYNNQFSTNMTYRGRHAVDNAFSLPYIKSNAFASRVVKTLFMISNLPDSTKVTFPSNLDNLIVLMMTSIDQNKLQLKKDIKDVLERLVSENIIREERNSYFFYTEDERDLTQLIKNQILNFDDKLISFDSFIRPILKVDWKHRIGFKDFKIGYAVDDKEFLRGGDVKVTVVLTDKTAIANRAISNRPEELLISINEWFDSERNLASDFEWFAKAEKYFLNNTDSATGARAQTLDLFKTRNMALRDKIHGKIVQKFPETRFISGNTIIESSEINGSRIQDRYKQLLEKHINSVYKYLLLAEDYAHNAAELRREAVNTQVSAPFLTSAEQTVDDFISTNGNTITIHDLVKHFTVKPFGWPDTAIIHMALMLKKKKKRDLVFNNQPRYPEKDFAEKALSSAERNKCEVKLGEEIDQSLIDKAIQDYRDIFNEDIALTTDGNELYDNLVSKLSKKRLFFKVYEEAYLGSYPFGKKFKELANILDDWAATRDPKRLFTNLHSNKSTTAKLIDDCKTIIDFMERAEEHYTKIISFMDNNSDNINSLGDDEKEKGNKIAQYLMSDDPVNNFRHIKKAYEELKKALSDLVKQLIDKAKSEYNQVFDELEAEAKRCAITEPNVYADRSSTIGSIGKLKVISEIRLKIANASNYRAEQLETILKYAKSRKVKKPDAPKVNDPETIYLSKTAKVIHSKEEMEEYLSDMRKKMTRILDNEKTIIIK